MEKSNILKKSLFFVLICVLIMVVLSIMVKYDVEGEKKLPFSISKILLVSTVDGQRVEDTQNIWDINVTQVNDIYMYIDKTGTGDETIKSITFENFVVNGPQKGNLKLLRPTGDLSNLYAQSEQNYLSENITYSGATIDDMKSLEIANNGGVAGFRFSLEDLGSFVSNEAEEIIYDGRLLSNLGINIEEIKFSVQFDVIIQTSENISYKGTLNLELPLNDVIEKGSSNMEITDFSNIIFKRI